MNGLNRRTAAALRWVLTRLADGFADAPARLAGVAAGLWSGLQGMEPAARSARMLRVEQRCRDGGFAVGVLGGIAVLMLAAGILLFRR
jgi:hypothetical protein